MNNKKIISGDVLFNMSIGRTDLPLCNHDDLINNPLLTSKGQKRIKMLSKKLVNNMEVLIF